MIRIVINFLLLAGCFIHAFSQNDFREDPYLKFDHYSNKDGLTHNKVLDILQDSEGYLWIATLNGLCRFDGYDFKQYYFDPDDSTSISANLVSCIAEDMSGGLWFGTTSGLNKYDPLNQLFLQFKNHADSIFKSSIIRALYADDKNNLWFETASGLLNKLHLPSSVVKSYPHEKPSMVHTYLYHSIIEDHKENIWVGGRYMGLFSFDPGTEKFSHLTTDPHDESKKRDSDVAVHFIDSRGTFWIGGTDGLYHFDQKTETFTKKLAVSTFSMAEDHQGKLWIGTGGGLYIYHPELKTFQFITHNDNNPHSLCHNHINKIFIDLPGNIWIGTNGGISVFRPAKNKFGHIFHIPGNDKTPESNHITAILEDQSGNLWLGTAENGVNVIDPWGRKKLSYSANHNGQFKLVSDKISVLKQDQAGDIWIGQWSGRGMNIINPDESINTQFRFLENALKADWYSDILHDRDGNHWLGLWGAQGLYMFDKKQGKITDDRFAPNTTTLDKTVKAIAFDGRRLWISVEGQNRFYCYDTKTSRLNYYLKDNYNPYPIFNIKDIFFHQDKTYVISNQGNYKIEYDPYLEIKATHENIPFSSDPQIQEALFLKLKENYQINAIVQDEKNITWVGTNRGLIMIDEDRFHVYDRSGLHSNWLSDTIWDLALLPENLLVLATEKGILTLDRSTKVFFPLNLNEKGYLSSRLIKFLYEDTQGSIWIGTTDKGINQYFPESGRFINYTDHPEDPDSFWGKQASCAIQDLLGNVWIGGQGLNIYNPTSGKFSHFTEDDGLASNDVRAIQLDKKGKIWAATSDGLSFLDPETLDIQNFYEKDGLQENEFSGASFALRNGYMAFGGKNGLNLFNPDGITRNENKPDVRITSFKIFEEAQNSIPQDEHLLELNYNENYFSFEFTALDYSNPDENIFAYKLDNVDAEWIYTEASNRVARYTNVDPGHYIFKVIAANSDGIWNKKGISIPLVIRPPFWKTTIFYSLIILLVVAIIILLMKYREKKIREQNQILLLEQKLLRTQMNPHFIFNSLSSIQSFIFENNPMTAGSYLSQFAELIRSILYNSREEFITLEKELQTLKNYIELQQLRYNNGFEYAIEVDPEIDPEEISIPPMLAQPFIENAIEHGIKHIQEKGEIRIAFNTDDQILLFTLTDNGIGLEAAKKIKNSKAGEHQSLATIITRERIDILNKSHRKNEYSVVIEEIKENNTVKGTRVRFTIPLKRKDLES